VKLMLDTNVLLEVCTPGRHQDAKEWFRRILLAPSPPELLASVVAVYELRGALEWKGATRSLEHFEEMSKSLRFVPLSVEVMLQAASLASKTRRTRRGQLSDSDVIIAAQALVEGAIVVTADTVFHAVPGLVVRHWNEVDPDRPDVNVVERLLTRVVAWAEQRPDVLGLALVGSHARGEAKPGSDVDLVVVVDSTAPYLEDDAWLSTFGDVQALHDEDYGLVRSRRATYRDGFEVEWGLADRQWLQVPPDRGTAEVVAAGMRILYDPSGALAALQRAATAVAGQPPPPGA
jgi:uncharacterized protein